MANNNERGMFLNKVLLMTCAAKEAQKKIELENKQKQNFLIRKSIEDIKNEILNAAQSGDETCTFFPTLKYPDQSLLITTDFYACVCEYFTNEGFHAEEHFGGIVVKWNLNQ